MDCYVLLASHLLLGIVLQSVTPLSVCKGGGGGWMVYKPVSRCIIATRMYTAGSHIEFTARVSLQNLRPGFPVLCECVYIACLTCVLYPRPN